MRIPRCYEPQPLQNGQTLPLGDSNVQHLARTLRMRAGDRVQLFNGDGRDYAATLVEVDKRRVLAHIDAAEESAREPRLKVHIGQCLSRGERMDYAVQKATETGMSRMTPLFSERCEVKLNSERQDKRQRHWQQVAVSACEQSLRCSVPDIDAPQPLLEWVQSVEADLKLVLHHHSARALGELPPPASVALLIGPEGGLSEAEVAAAAAAGFQPVCFGPRVLRTETAPVAAQAILHYLWGDWA
ncbi:ribosomal RNA small subunit methyltransferase E [Marinobacterium nitratireducens]|uniref:Ribosomal RNA small subunit methyltransferase E n=1 Tax=Marinobacterium nitratireducens TaxID=518897 RepID=A0A917ZB52_9GAMM|nr:16S rRNA (uracil(1498)-N(3))-methyltransferase [Marinobacterium nitratireducens]GGO78118.1 ribosomal RNA small subunit methyltransferase E [Marinobacterium nitratireducens]